MTKQPHTSRASEKQALDGRLYRESAEVAKADDELRREITEREHTEEAFKQTHDYLENLFNYANAPIIVWDPSFRITRFNPAFEHLTGYLADEVVGKELSMLFPESSRAVSLNEIERTLTGEHWESVDIPILRKDGSIRLALWNSAGVYSHDGKTLIATIAQGQDITERKQAEDRLRFFVDAGTLFAGSLDYTTTLTTVAQLAVPQIADWCTVDMLEEDGSIQLLALSHVNPEKVKWAYELRERYPIDPDAPVGAPKVIRTGEPEFYPDIPDSLLVSIAKNEEELRILREVGYRSVMAVPLQARGRMLGSISLVAAEAHRNFTAEDLDLAMELAQRAAVAIDNARLYREVQQLNENLERQAQDLQTANQELEAFSYSVSHDLRAPLRAINGFSRILTQDYSQQLTPEAQRFLNLVRDNAQQMGRLIDGLLNFSRLNRQTINKQPILPSVIVRQVLADLRNEQEGRRVEVSVDDLPTIKADALLLRQVYANLLSNALKFTRRREVAMIEIGCRREGDEPIFFVRDNGVGFDMQYANKLFGVFQRLHTAEEYEGTGVGLATVQRIIHRHGGRVWADAEIDRGATFYFSIGGGNPND